MSRNKATAKLRRESRKSLRGGKVQSFDYDAPQIDNNVERIGMENSKYDRSPLEARNENQQRYLDALESKLLIFSTGSAGSGKTFLATAFAADRLLDKTYEKIIVTRPVLTAEEEMGFLPGTVMEKFMPFFRPVYDVLKERLGAGFLEYCLRPQIEKIEIAPFSFMRGRNFKNSVVILDEAQNVTPSQLKLFLTRISDNCLVIVNGDVLQCDLPKHKVSGLADAMTRFEENEIVGTVEFAEEDSVRGPICSLALAVYK